MNGILACLISIIANSFDLFTQKKKKLHWVLLISIMSVDSVVLVYSSGVYS